MLRVEGLSAGYGRVTVVRGLDLTVEAGEVVALLGPNGAGKTTVLRAVSGLARVTAGRVVLGDTELTLGGGVPPWDRARLGVAHVPDGRGVFPGLTVREHFRLGPPGERLDEEAVHTWFPALRPLASRRAGLLSGGEQQMLAIGRALARRPRLLLLDEPSLGLAPVIVDRLLPVVRSYAADSGCAVLLVEQQVRLALEAADRVCVLSGGRVSLRGPAAGFRGDIGSIMASYLGGPAPA